MSGINTSTPVTTKHRLGKATKNAQNHNDKEFFWRCVPSKGGAVGRRPKSLRAELTGPLRCFPRQKFFGVGMNHGQLPGMGGVFNSMNLNLWHYGGNNPIKYVDPDGRWIDNKDGTYTAEAGDTLGSLYGANWRTESGFQGDPSSLKVGQIVGIRINPSEAEIIVQTASRSQVPRGITISDILSAATRASRRPDFIWPTSGRITARYNDTISSGGRSWRHNGVDIAGNEGLPVMATRAGTVVMKKTSDDGLNYVVVQHNNGKYSSYLHLKDFADGYEIGSVIRQGFILGWVGNTGGLSMGPHLHFGIRDSASIRNNLVGTEDPVKLMPTLNPPAVE